MLCRGARNKQKFYSACRCRSRSSMLDTPGAVSKSRNARVLIEHHASSVDCYTRTER